MKPDRDERLSSEPTRSKPVSRVLIAAGAIAIILILYFVLDLPTPGEIPPPVVIDAQESVTHKPALVPAADIPEPVPPAAAAEQAPALAPPTPESSDTELRARFEPTGEGILLSKVLQSDNLLQRAVTAISGLNRGFLARKALPVPPPGEKFSVLSRDGQLILDRESYRRYDSYADAIAELDTDTLASTFHRFRPLLEQSYAELGHAPGDFDNTVIRALDTLLAAPVIEREIALKRHEAVYQFMDAELEAMSPLHKQLLRMGPANTSKIIQQAKALRERLLHEPR